MHISNNCQKPYSLSRWYNVRYTWRKYSTVWQCSMQSPDRIWRHRTSPRCPLTASCSDSARRRMGIPSDVRCKQQQHQVWI